MKMAKMSDFESAFAAARKAQGAGGKFTFNGKSYSTDYAGEKGPKKKPVTPAAQKAAYGQMASTMKQAGVSNVGGKTPPARAPGGGGARGSARAYKSGGKVGKK
jgi:hypothetical protein